MIGETWEQSMERKAQTAALEARRTMLRSVLEGRFNPLPEAVLQRINQCEDSAKLEAAARESWRLKSPDELQL